MPRKKPDFRSRSRGLYKPTARSRVTNGMAILPEVDGRSLYARRYRDLNVLLVSDLGVSDEEELSEGQRQLIRRTAALSVELERCENKFALQGGATEGELHAFQRATNTLRRTIESLGIHRGRIARDVNSTLDLDTYLRLKAQDNTRYDNSDIIDVEEVDE